MCAELRLKLWQLKARSDLDERYAQTAIAALERRLQRALDAERAARAKHSAERATPCCSPSPRPSRSPRPMKMDCDLKVCLHVDPGMTVRHSLVVESTQ